MPHKKKKKKIGMKPSRKKPKKKIGYQKHYKTGDASSEAGR